MRLIRVMLSFGLLLIALAAGADIQTVTDSRCFGHRHLLGGAYAYTEDFGTAYQTVSAQQPAVTIVEGCGAYDYVNFTNTEIANVVIRGWVKVKPTTAPGNTVMTFSVLIDGNIAGVFDRALSSTVEAQGFELGTVVPTLLPGQHRIKLACSFSPYGQIAIQESFIVVQGSPLPFGAAAVQSGVPMTIDGTWRPIAGPITVTPSATSNLLLDGSVRFLNGTPGQWVSFGFQLDDAPSSIHTIDAAVPQNFPSGLTVLDHLASAISTDRSHTVTLWAVNRSGGQATIDLRSLDAIGFDATDPAATPVVDTIITSPLVVGAGSDGTIPLQPVFQDCSGGWTTVMELKYSAITPSRDQNMVGEGYIEIINTAGIPPQPQPIDIVVQVFHNPTFASGCDSLQCPRQVVTDYESSNDFTMVRQIVPAGRSQKFFFMHPVLWGTGKDNVVRVVMRRLGCFMGSGDITIGKRYMALKAIPVTGATTLQVGPPQQP